MPLEIGPYRLDAVLTGFFRLDGGSMFGAVPKPLWERKIPADDRNRIPLATRSLLLRDGKRTILVDTGNGDKWTDKERDIYAIDPSEHSIDAALGKLGLSVDDVTDVVLTHLHFDHTGGSTRREGDRFVPAFSKGTYHVHKTNWEHALERNEREAASYIPENFVPIEEAGQLHLVEGEPELFPGVHVEVCNGHTTGMQLLRVSDGKTTLLYCADLVPTVAHLPLPWIMGYDIRAIETLAEKKRLHERAVPGGWILFFEHDPETAAGIVGTDDRGRIALKETVTL